jgi:hypothetical protein
VYRFFYGAVADVSLYQQRGNKKSETEATKERRTKATGNTEKAKQDLDRYSTMWQVILWNSLHVTTVGIAETATLRNLEVGTTQLFFMNTLELTKGLSIEELQERNEFSAVAADACCEIEINICPDAAQ